MSGRIKHHPTDYSLARFAARTLESGPALVVAAHLESCHVCRDRTSKFEAVGGVLLSDLAPAPMEPGALQLALARLDRRGVESSGRERKASHTAERLGGLVLPRALSECEIGPWRWGGPGFRWSNVRLPHDKTANIMLMRIATGRKMPDHGHTGSEFTLVLKGSFSDKDGRYFPGDLSEVDAETEHQPIVDHEGECICLAAVEGSLRLRGFFGRLLNPFMG